MNSWAIFYGIVIFQGIFVSFVLLVTKKGNKSANRVLSILISLLTLYLLDILLGMLGFFDSNPHFLHITTPLWYLFPPLTFVYIKYQTRSSVYWNVLSFLHLIPFLIILYQFLPFYPLPVEIKLQYFRGELSPPGSILLKSMYVLLSPLQVILYASLIFFKLLRDKITEYIHTAHIFWLKIFFGLILVFGLVQLALLSNWLITGEVILPFKFAPLTFFSVIIYSIAYFAIVQPDSIFPFYVLKARKVNGIQQRDLADKLKTIMETKKPFLNSELRYSELAAQLGVSVRYLTEILNREIGMSFNDFVNSYRINEVKERIRDNKNANLTLLAISLDAGFNSKTSFNRIFKKHTGLTPSEFISQTNE